MDLSTAIQLTNQWIITGKHIEDYDQLILQYLLGLVKIFKDTQLQPIHHVSMHAGDFLHLFRPTHLVCTPGFEWFNEKLGSQNTNQKSGEFLCCHLSNTAQTSAGELEATFAMTACRTANLEWMMQDQGIHDSVQPLVEAFSKVSNEDH